MNWDDVQTMLAVARAGQLHAAGAQLGVDRTTVSRRIAALEARLGTALFTRTRTGLQVTAAGQRAVDHASRMEKEARALETSVAPPSVTGVVRLAVTEALAPFLVEQGLLSVCDDHPGLRIDLLAGNRRVDLEAGEADLALRLDPLHGAALKARCLNRAPAMLYASTTYVQRRGAPRSVKQLRGHDVVAPSGELTRVAEGAWLSAQPGVVVTFTSNSMPALVAAACRGRGIVSLTGSWGDRQPELQRLFAPPHSPMRALWLVSTAEAAKRPACAAVTKHLVALFAEAQR